ncbi:hypothetical protein GNI_144620, partial [Gregarina niphandrodes]
VVPAATAATAPVPAPSLRGNASMPTMQSPSPAKVEPRLTDEELARRLQEDEDAHYARELAAGDPARARAPDHVYSERLIGPPRAGYTASLLGDAPEPARPGRVSGTQRPQFVPPSLGVNLGSNPHPS